MKIRHASVIVLLILLAGRSARAADWEVVVPTLPIRSWWVSSRYRATTFGLRVSILSLSKAVPSSL
jgi:hypothetical protein